jgi:hypothetical protein
MSFLSLILAACFGLTGLLLCAIIIRVLYEALVGPQKGWAERWKVRQREKQLALIDQLIDGGDLSGSFKQLRQTLYFDVVKYDPDLVERISVLHFSALNKLIALAGSRDQHVPELGVLEDLFSSRTSLLRSCGEVVTSRNALMRKRNNKMPEWAFDEYQKKLAEFADQLDTNRKSIENQLDRVFISLNATASSAKDEIIYH